MIWEKNIWKSVGNTILFIVIVPFFLLYLPFALLVYVVISLFLDIRKRRQ